MIDALAKILAIFVFWFTTVFGIGLAVIVCLQILIKVMEHIT